MDALLALVQRHALVAARDRALPLVLRALTGADSPVVGAESSLAV